MVAAFASAGAAIACAVEMQRAIDREARRGAVALELRVGVAAGDVAWAGEDYSGTPVIEAQRLCAAASAGSILVADAVRLLAGSGTEAELEDAGELELSDLARPVRAWSVGWTARRAVTVPFPASLVFDGGTAFAGREEELAELRAAWADAVSGSRRGVLVSGEPGIGKTRLAAEIAGHARAREGVVLYGRCDDGLSAPAQPFAQALGAYVAACPVDELRVELGARASDLIQLLPELAARLPGGVAEPAPAEPEIQRLRTLEAAAALLEAAGEAAPVLLVLDDLHWADELSLLLLRHLLRADAAAAPARGRHLPRHRAQPLAPARRRRDRPGAAAGRRPHRARPAARARHRGDPRARRARVVTCRPRAARHRGQPVLRRRDGPRARRRSRSRCERSRRVCATSCAGGSPGCPSGRPTCWRSRPSPARSSTPTSLPARSASSSTRRWTRWRPPSGAARASRRHPGSVHVRARARARDDRRRAAGRPARAPSRADRARARAHRRHASRCRPATWRRTSTPPERSSTPRRPSDYSRRAGDEAAARLAFDVAAEQYERALRAHERLPSATENERLDLELARGRALSLAGDDRAHAVLRDVAAAADAAGDGGRMAEALLTIRLEYADFLEEDAEMVALLRRALALLPPGDSAIRASLEGFSRARGVLQHARPRAPGDGRPRA